MIQNIKPKNSKNQNHGLWIHYFSNGKLCYKGQFINDIEYGYWIDNWTKYKPQIRFFLT